ncbi:hypothetical protein [Caulobacter sp.]|uniref:hypothetical protein n=1 Tax=Caulobacter sp. TaxID=78 RepID=UPI0031D91A04
MALAQTPFYNNAAMRERLLADVRSQGLLTSFWLGGGASEARFETIAAEFVLDRALVRLISALAGGLGPEAIQFAQGAIEALAMDRPSAPIAYQWLRGVWSRRVADKLEGSDALAPAQAVVALLEQAAQGEVSSEYWRSANRALVFLEDLAPQAADYAEVVQAMSWDPAATPGMVGDVLIALQSAARQDIFRAENWSAEQDQAYSDVVIGCQTRAAEQIPEEDRTDRGRFEEAYRAKFSAEYAAAPDQAFLRRAEEVHQAVMANAMQLAADEQKAFLELLSQPG